MAVTAARTTGDFAGFLRPDQAGYIFEEAARQSVVMQLAPRVPLGPNGAEIPVVTGRMSAGWVAEAGQKPASQASLGIKTITPKKIAAIAVVSAEVVRANPGGYMNVLRPQIAEAFAVAFDNAALHDFGPNGEAGGGPFATFIDQTTKSVELGTSAQGAGGIHRDFVAGLGLLVDANKRLTGFALDERIEPLLWGAVDTTGRPLYVELPTDDTSATLARPGRLLNRPTFMGSGLSTPVVAGTPNTGGIVAYGGNWTQCAWGAVGGISYDVSTQATVTINGVLTSLWENNLLAIRAEAEYGWVVNDTAAFVKYANATA